MAKEKKPPENPGIIKELADPPTALLLNLTPLLMEQGQIRPQSDALLTRKRGGCGQEEVSVLRRNERY